MFLSYTKCTKNISYKASLLLNVTNLQTDFQLTKPTIFVIIMGAAFLISTGPG